MPILSRACLAGLLAASMTATPAAAKAIDDFASQDGCAPSEPAAPPPREALDEAWWTGPMLASGAGTLPHGHWLIEPYLFDVRGRDGDTLGSLTYILYGLTDRFTVGAIPTFAYNRPDAGRDSSRIGIGDLTLSGQYRLTRFRPGHWTPTTSIVVQETLPTGTYDRLHGRAANGFGGGAYATMVALYAQTYAWAPNGRVVRLRLNGSATVSGATRVTGDSVYGTAAGFRGRAKPGTDLMVDAAFEYSATQNWVLAMDLVWRHDTATRVSGVGADGGLVQLRAAAHDSLALAPAVEYNFSPRVGALVGLRVIPPMDGHRSSVTPAVALNMVY
ncbi:MAG: transporter [Caulobacterales bacterium]|nr:transporter [Caulobacterales bacterium]